MKLKKEILFIFLTLLLLLAAGCSGNRTVPPSQAGKDMETENLQSAEIGQAPEKHPYPTDAPAASPAHAPTAEPSPESGLLAGQEVAYVLIYNPNIYFEDLQWNEKLNTGDFGKQIDIDMSRADGAVFEPEYLPVAQESAAELFGTLEADLSGMRAGGLQPVYRPGDRHDFYVSADGTGNARVLKSFDCMYAGETCCLWSMDAALSEADAKVLGEEFDRSIYKRDTEMFGLPRYADDGGKVHLLFYHIPDQGILGFFTPLDIFATGEASDSQVKDYALNLNHAILHINAAYAGYPELRDLICATMAHELQHLINATDLFYTLSGIYAGTWLNEAMSGYAEETQYPGIKDLEGHYAAFAYSDLIRHGQSLFNFDTNSTDIGVYGSVFLFSQYLENLADNSVFRKIHDYWRSSYSMTLDEAEALYHAVPEKAAGEINTKYLYPAGISFNTKEQEWMSKLVLDFYLSLLRFDPEDPAAYANVQAQTLLYDEINPAAIEGGGRVIVATKNGNYVIPDDADYGLLYVGLNADFQPVTDIVFK